jgi:Icc-related predicted phosphoesterase
MERGNEKHFRDRLPRNVHYLRDSGVEINGLKFWGTPWTPQFFNWSFMGEDDAAGIGKHFEKIPSGVDYLLSHGPASGHNDLILDPTRINGHKLGSAELLKHVKRASPSVLLVGHIHTGSHEYSNISNKDPDNPKNTLSINVSILDEGYRPHYMALYNTEE